MVDQIPARSQRTRLRRVGAAFADELLRAVRLRPAGTLAAGAERVCAVMRALGFHAAVIEVSGGRVVIEAAACPLRPLVREDAAVAEVDRGMWIGLAARALEGVDLERIECGTHRCHDHGSCRVTLAVSATPS